MRLVWVFFLALSAAAQQPYDVVIANGRVMDPESGLDAVRHVGIRGGRIEAISALPLKGKTMIEAKGKVVEIGRASCRERVCLAV